MSLDLPSISAVSTKSILFAQVPAFDTVHNKLVSFVDGVPSLPNSSKTKDELAQEIFPWLKQCYLGKSKAPTSPAVVAAFGKTISALVADLLAASMFPLFDVWRLAILEPTIAQVTLMPLVKVLTANSTSVSSSRRATLLILLRLTMKPSARHFPDPYFRRWGLWKRGGRSRACSCRCSFMRSDLYAWQLQAWHLTSVLWCRRAGLLGSRGKKVADGIRADEEGGEWEVELVSAVVDALASMEESEDAGE
jgi:desumoylating isopeptidase 1